MPVSETQRMGIAAVLLISLTVYGIFFLHAQRPVREAPLPWGTQDGKRIAVEVSGDRGVNGGIYFLPEGLTIEETLRLVGIKEKNRTRKINPIRIVAGSVLAVSPQGEVAIGEMAAVKKLALGLPVDLNGISEEELFLIPGIGERMASQIVQMRNEMGGFRNLEELMALPGIKEKKLNSLKRYLTVGTVRKGFKISASRE